MMRYIIGLIVCSAASYLAGRSISDRANDGRVRRARENAEGWEAMYREQVERRNKNIIWFDKPDHSKYIKIDWSADPQGLRAEDDFDFYSVDSIDATEH